MSPGWERILMTRFVLRLSACAAACAFTLAARATDEIVVRLAPNWASPEHAAALVHGWGKVLWKEGARGYRIQLRNGIAASEAVRRVAGRTGVEAARPSWRPGLASLDGDLDTLGAMIADLKLQAREKGIDAEEGGLDYFEAYQDYVWQRAYPGKAIDWSVYGEAIAQRERMPHIQPGETDSGALWEFMGPTNLDIPYHTYYGTRPINGRVNGLAWDPVDPATYYLAAAGGGVWKTTDAGGTWVPLSDDWPTMHANAVAVDPANRNVVYAGTGDFHGGVGYSLGLMKSTDGGSTWSLKGAAQFGNKSISSIAIDPDNTNRLLVSTGRGASGGNGNVWQSNDGGETWATTLGTATVWWEVCFGARNPVSGTRWIYAAGSGAGGNVWRSGDRGATWSKLTPPIGAGNHARLEVATSRIAPDTVYLLAPADRKILKSLDGGTTWIDITTGFINGSTSNPTYNWSQSTYDAFIACSSKSGIDVVYVGLIDVAQSTDAGLTWRSIGGPTWLFSAIVHNDHQSVAVSPHDPNQVLFGSDGGVYRMTYTPTTNAFAWSMLSRNLGVSQFYKSSHHPTNPDIAVGGTQDNATPVSTGDLLNWRNQGGGDGGFCAINQINPSYQYVTAQFLAIYRTTNGWGSYSMITPSTGSDSKLFIAPIHLNQANPNYLYAGTNYLWRWNEATGSWTPRLGGRLLAASGAIRSIATSPASSTRIYTGATNGDVYMTSDGGSTWTQIDVGVASLPNRQITSIDVHPTDPDDVLVTVSGSGVGRLWRCTNPGAGAAARTWADVSGSGLGALPNVQANSVARDLDHPTTTWFVGSDVGVFVTSDSGLNWSNMTQSLGLPNIQVNDLHPVAGTRMLNAATYGRGLWRLALPLDNATLVSLAIAPDSVQGGEGTTGEVTLSGGAALAGSSVTLSTSSPLASTPGSVVVPFGQTSATFPITTLPVGTSTFVEVSGTRQSTIRTAAMLLRPAAGVVVPNWFSVSPGILVSGGLTELFNPEDQRLVARLNLASEEVGFPITLSLRGTSPTENPSALRFVVEGFSELSGVRQTIQLFDWIQGTYVTVDSRFASRSDSTVTVAATGALARFVQPGTRTVAARIGWEPVAAEVAYSWRVQVDRAWWVVE